MRPFCDPSLASRRISLSSVVSSFSSLRAGINRSSNSTSGVPSLSSSARAGAASRAVLAAVRVPKAFGTISPSTITRAVKLIENTVRAVPCSPWWLKTTAARAPNIKLPKMLKRLLVITNITKTLASRPLRFCSSWDPLMPRPTMSCTRRGLTVSRAASTPEHRAEPASRMTTRPAKRRKSLTAPGGGPT